MGKRGKPVAQFWVSTMPGGPPKVAPLSPSDQSEIERLFPNKFGPPQFDEIARISQAYVGIAQAKKNAAPLSEIASAFELLAIRAKNLMDAIPAKREVWNAVDVLIDERAHSIKAPGFKDLSHLNHCMLLFKMTCEEQSRLLASDMERGGSWREIRPFDGFVADLEHLCKSLGVRVSASSGSDKKKHDAPSPFVQLVAIVQRALPPAFREGVSSNDALSQAVKQARARCKALSNGGN